MNLSFLRRRTERGHTTPHAEPTRVGVNVTLTQREAKPDGIEYVRDDALTARIGKHLPNAGKDTPSQNLQLARAAAVLDRYADYLEGNGPAPELGELIATNRMVAEHIRDGIVIA